ncbi:hypothetical protein DD906_13110, partial [Staphylococcus pseudintermedius]
GGSGGEQAEGGRQRQVGLRDGGVAAAGVAGGWPAWPPACATAASGGRHSTAPSVAVVTTVLLIDMDSSRIASGRPVDGAAHGAQVSGRAASGGRGSRPA